MTIGLATVVLSSCSLQAPITAASQDQGLVGKAAPDWEGTNLDGKPIALKDFQGKPIFLNFWASWCGPCRAEQPAIDRIAVAYAARGLQVVGVDIRDNLEQARIYRDEFQIPYPSIFDQAARLGYAYQVDAPPGSVFIDGGGVVRYKVTGALGEEAYRRIIEEKLLVPVTPSP